MSLDQMLLVPGIDESEAGGVVALLLDTYTGAAAAYSLRKLRTGSPNAIRVRRSSDSTEQDIGFVSGALDTATLLTFCGAGDGFVTTWYDQSGNGNNQTQTTAGSQPKIVSSGSYLGGISFDGTDDKFSGAITGFKSFANLSSFFVSAPVAAAAADTASAGWFIFGNGSPTLYGLSSSTGSISGEKIVFLGTTQASVARRLGSTTYSRSANQTQVLSMLNLPTGTSLRSNGVSISLDLASLTTISSDCSPSSSSYTVDDIVYLNGAATFVYPAALWKEAIFYGSNQSSNRTGIESNINSHYSIY